eukprot:2245719-Rhodomonas_salina.1
MLLSVWARPMMSHSSKNLHPPAETLPLCHILEAVSETRLLAVFLFPLTFATAASSSPLFLRESQKLAWSSTGVIENRAEEPAEGRRSWRKRWGSRIQ